MKYNITRMYGAAGYSSSLLMVMNDQIHTPAALPPDEKHALPNG
jgi:hypothetical protein